MFNKFKSIPRSEVCANLIAYRDAKKSPDDKIIEAHKENIRTMGFLKQYLSKGEEVNEVFCPVCKKWHILKRESFLRYNYYYHEYKCPICGNLVDIYTGRSDSKQMSKVKTSIIHVFDNGCILFADVQVFKKHGYLNNLEITIDKLLEKPIAEIMEALEKDIVYGCHYQNYSIFIPGKGMHDISNYNYNVKISNKYLSGTISSLDCYVEKPEELLNNLNNIYEIKAKDLTTAVNEAINIDNRNHEKNVSEKAKAKETKTDAFNSYLLGLPIPSYEYSKILNPAAIYFIDDDAGANYGGYFVCPVTDKIIYHSISKEMTKTTNYYGGLNQFEIVCPICGKIHTVRPHKKSSYTNSVNISDSAIALNFSDEWLIVRVFEKVIYFDYNKPSTVVANIREMRTYFNGKKCIEFVIDINTGKFSVSNHSKIADSYRSHKHVQSDTEILDAIKASKFNRCGLLESWGLNPVIPNKICEIFSFRYLNFYFEHPFIEQLLKCGLSELTRDLISNSYYKNEEKWAGLNRNGTTPAEILNVSKSDFNIIRVNNFNFYKYKRYVEFKSVDKTLTLENFEFIFGDNGGLRNDRMFLIAKNFNIPFAKQIEYAHKMYNHQCIPYSEGITIWDDYLNMGKHLRYDFSDKNILYPTSLKKEHDIAVFAYENIKAKIRKEQFQESVNEAKYLAYKNKDFIVKLPVDAEEVVNEGKSLKHCVASYVNKIADKHCAICFIRKKDEPDVPFYTVEVGMEQQIVQVKGFCNCAPTEEVAEFIKEWAEVKKLSAHKHY